MHSQLTALAVAAMLFGSSAMADLPLAKVSVLESGQLLLNGRPSDLAAIEAECQRLQEVRGVVWYYRENSQSEPRPGALKVLDAVMKYRLPISMSSKPDFSDYVDSDGLSRPRKP